MLMKSYLVGMLSVLAIFVVPSVSQAYSTTAQSAIDLGNNKALFTITYKFGFLNREAYLPILASRNKNFEASGPNAGYAVLFNGKTEAKAASSTMQTNDVNLKLNYSILPGKAKAIVLSDAQIKDGRYFLPKGKSGTFTLVAIVDMSTIANKDDMSLLMTSLPFTMIDNGKRMEAQLNPSELQYYKTPELDLK